MKNQQGLQGSRRLLGGQLILTLLATSVFGLWYGSVGALSAGLGGLICAVPNACFAYLLFRDARSSASRQIMRRVYRGEALKLGLSMVFFTLTFCCINIIPMVFFVVYLLVQLTCWVAPWVFVTR